MRGHATLLSIVVCLLLQSGAAAQQVQSAPVAPPGIGYPHDWSHRHVIFTNGGSPAVQAAQQKDPRLLHNWLYRTSMLLPKTPAAIGSGIGTDVAVAPPPALPISTTVTQKVTRDPAIDWAISLGGTGGLALAEYPAKFSFDTSTAITTANCTSDFAVYTIQAAAGSGTQANLIGLNNLYTGTTTSYCPNGAQTPPTTDYTAPKFLFSYAIGTSTVYLSPALSLDGKKIAMVDGGNPALFWVVKWASLEGTNATTGAVSPSCSGTAGVACLAAVGSTALSVSFTNITVAGCTAASSQVSNASPYIDYDNDAAYVADDKGRLYRIKNVFNGTPALDYCITVSAGNAMTSPVHDAVHNVVFVSDGKSMYGFTPGATSFTAAGSISLARNNTGIILPPIVDVTNGYVYAFSRSNTGNTNSIVSRMPTNLSTHSDINIGPATTTEYVWTGAFDEIYYNSGPTATGATLYACGTQTASSSKPALYAIDSPTWAIVMNGNANINGATNPNGMCSPLTEFYDGTTDRLFVGAGAFNGTTGSNLVTMWDITNQLTSTATNPTKTATNELGGTSGFSVDNKSSAPQATSVYFGTLAKGAAAPCGANLFCAVKLTQSGLQ